MAEFDLHQTEVDGFPRWSRQRATDTGETARAGVGRVLPNRVDVTSNPPEFFPSRP